MKRNEIQKLERKFRPINNNENDITKVRNGNKK